MQPAEFLETAYQYLIENDIRRSFYLAGQRFVVRTYAGQQENKRGYDLEVCAYVPLFLQLKVSHFHPAFSKASVVAARKRNGITDNPGCYAFSLHPDKKSNQYRQHNLLADLHARGCYARYIAPLFHTESDLEHFKYSLRAPYWGPSAMGFWDDGWFGWRNYLSFDHSISILPHKQISDPTTTPHQYTYSTKNLVCFHSEAERIENGKRFLSSIDEELSRAASGEPMSLMDINERIANSLRLFEDTAQAINIEIEKRQTPTRRFYFLAKLLKRRYKVDCVLVAKRG
jgi:hypothetical protein